jgi:hypothetical protein
MFKTDKFEVEVQITEGVLSFQVTDLEDQTTAELDAKELGQLLGADEFDAIQEAVQEVDADFDLTEFKADFGDPSEIEDNKNKEMPGRKGDQKGGEEKPILQGSSKDSSTRMGMINAMVSHLVKKDKGSIKSAHDSMLGKGEDGKGEGQIPQGDSKIKQPTKVTSEDLDLEADVKALFGDEDLSDEFKEKATLVMETAVLTKINEHIEGMALDTEALLEAERDAILDEMADKLSSYMEYVVEDWGTKNELAIERGVKADIAESVLKGIRAVFTENHIDIPEEKVDFVDELTVRVEELEGKLDESLKRIAEQDGLLKQGDAETVIAEISEGLVDTDAEKFVSLAEGIEFEDAESYAEKLTIIKESYFDVDSQPDVKINVDDGSGDDIEGLEEDNKVINENVAPQMAGYAESISRQVRK